MELDFAVISNLGDRSVNEDSCGSFHRAPEQWLFAVADGLGGHGKGEVASQQAVEAALNRYKSGPPEEPLEQLMGDLFAQAQEQVLTRQQAEHCPGGMKTTLNLTLVEGDQMLIGHVGDSRTYVFRRGAQLLRTVDHSVPQMLVMTGEIKEGAIRHHPDRNRLLRVLGAEWDGPKYVLEQPMTLQPGDAVLMCTDGFWEWITEREMLKEWKRAKNVTDWLRRMDACVQHNGRRAKKDNNTAVALWIAGGSEGGRRRWLW